MVYVILGIEEGENDQMERWVRKGNIERQGDLKNLTECQSKNNMSRNACGNSCTMGQVGVPDEF